MAHVAPSPSRWRLGWIVAIVAGAVALWWLLGAVLAVDRGMDITDEGLYLLAADPPSEQAAWLIPWGWHTSPMMSIVGYDIARLRTLAAFVLVVAGAGVGWAAVRAVMLPDRSRRLPEILAPILGGVGSLMMFNGLLRTPGYNWVNGLGLCLGAAGLLMLVSILRGQRGTGRAPWKAFGAVALLGLGMMITLPSKPTSAAILLVSTFVLLMIFSTWRRAVAWSALACGAMIAWVVVAIITRIWPVDFISVVKLSTSMPVPAEGQTVSGALVRTLAIPGEFIKGLQGLPVVALGMIGLGLLLAIVPLFARRRLMTLRIAGFSLVALVGIYVAIPVQMNPSVHAVKWSSPSILTGALCVLLAAFLVAGGTSWRRETWVAAFLALLPFAFGFGSGAGAFTMGSLVAWLVLLAAFLVVLPSLASWGTLAGQVVPVFAAIATTIGIIAVGWQFPYRGPPISESTVSTAVGTHGQGINVNADLASVIGNLRATPGWAEGTPMVGLSWTWASGIPYSMGARVSNSLMTVLLGYPTTDAIVAHNVSAPYRDFPFGDAWFLTTLSTTLKPAQQAEVEGAAAEVSAASGKSFPRDYRCVAHVSTFLLWQPRAAGEAGPETVSAAESQCPAGLDADSQYGGRGWTG